MYKRTFGLLFSVWAMIATAQAGELTNQLQDKPSAYPHATTSGAADKPAKWKTVPVAKVPMAEPTTPAGRCACSETNCHCLGSLNAATLWAVPTLSVMSLNGWTPDFINSVTNFAIESLPSPDTMRLLGSCLRRPNPVAEIEAVGFCLQLEDLMLNQAQPAVRQPFDVKHKGPEPGPIGMSLTF